MAVERVRCAECSRMILPEVAAVNAGLCRECAGIPDTIRRAKREFEEQVASGSWFSPSSIDLSTAKRPTNFGVADATWNPEPEYHKGGGAQPVQETISNAAKQSAGYVFLVSTRHARLNLSFNEVYGVCDYQDEDCGDSLYAYTTHNVREQVASDRQLAQACTCCGVGLQYYPSRFHMPRQTAFDAFLAVVTNRETPIQLQWLDCGDFSWTVPGRG